MENEPSSTQRTTSSQRLTREQIATRQAKLLLGCYRRSEAVDPDVYIYAIACVLAGYAESVIYESTHPRTGIQASEKFRGFPPNSGEVKDFCDDLAERNARHAKLASLPRPNLTPRLLLVDDTPGRLANLFVGNDKPAYQAMCERAKTADPKWWCWYRDDPKWGSGIKVPMSWYQQRGSVQQKSPLEAAKSVLDRYAAEAQRQPQKDAAE